MTSVRHPSDQRYHLVVQSGPGAGLACLLEAHREDVRILTYGLQKLWGSVARFNPRAMIEKAAAQLYDFSSPVDRWHAGEDALTKGSRQ